MKKLYAQGYLRLSMLGVGVGCLIFLYGCYTSIKSNVKGSELLIIFGIGLILLTIYKLQMIFPYTWVKYGNGCITISRISKEKNTHEKKRKKIDIKLITSFLLNKMIKDLYHSGPAGIPLEPGTISHYLRGLRALYNKAKLYYNNEDFDIIRIPGDPFKKAEIPEYRRKRKNIDINTLLKIRDFQSDKKRTNMARDVFMMMFYMMGVNINDLYSISCERRGRLEYMRSKTNTEKNHEQIPLSVKIEPELRILLDKYTEGYFLSYFHTNYCSLNNFMRAINNGLKDICMNLELDFKVTTNWARHSWASLARNKAGVPKADIDFCLGHVNNDYKMADIYIDIDYSICDKANRAVLDLLQKKEEKKD